MQISFLYQCFCREDHLHHVGQIYTWADVKSTCPPLMTVMKTEVSVAAEVDDSCATTYRPSSPLPKTHSHIGRSLRGSRQIKQGRRGKGHNILSLQEAQGNFARSFSEAFPHVGSRVG